MMEKKLKLYVWENLWMSLEFPGIVVAFAESPEHALQVLKKSCGLLQEKLDETKPREITGPEGFICWGDL